MSYSYLNGKNKAVITYGPLEGCEKMIRKLDKNNHLVFLDFAFMDRPIKAGLTILTAKELKMRNLYDENIEIDLKELISKITQL